MSSLFRTLEQKVEPSHTALIVVDMQNDLCSYEGSFAKMGVDVSHMNGVLFPVSHLASAAEQAGVLTIYTQVIDTYMPAVSPPYYEANLSFYESRTAEEAGDGEDAPWITRNFGEEFCPPISPTPRDVVIVKHRYGAFANTKLQQVLRSNDIRTLVICGVMTEVCVESTARAALDNDYYVVIPEDCTATADQAAKDFSLRTIGTYFGTITNSGDIADIWKASSSIEQ